MSLADLILHAASIILFKAAGLLSYERSCSYPCGG